MCELLGFTSEKKHRYFGLSEDVLFPQQSESPRLGYDVRKRRKSHPERTRLRQ